MRLSRTACRALAAALLLTLAWAAPASAQTNSTESPAELKVFNFINTPLSDILRLFTEMTKKNVVATPTILKDPITLYLENVPPLVALGILCKNYNYWYSEEDGVIRVMKLEEYGRELMLRRDERTLVIRLKYASCIGVAETIRNVFQDAIEYQSPSEQALTSYGHVGTDELPDIGREMEESSGAGKRATSSPRQAGKDAGAIAAGDVEMDRQELARLRQIAESGGAVTTSELLEYNVGKTKAQLTIFPRNNAVLLRSVDARLLADIRDMVAQLDTPTPQVLLECKILEVQLTDGFESFFDFNLTPGGKLDSSGTVATDIPGKTASALGGAGLGQSSLSFTMLHADIQARMQLMQSEGRLRSLASPLVYTANNAAARFFQGDKTPVRTGYTVKEATYSSDGSTLLTPAQVVTAYEVQDIGVTLEVSPSINQDRTVTLKLVADLGSVVVGGGPAFNYNVGGVAQVGQTDLVTQTKIEDIILAKDAQSLAIGGMIREAKTEDVSKVPVLGDIPVLGFFFKSQAREMTRTEIIFVLTAHILENPEGGAALNQRVMPGVSEHPWYKGQERILRFDDAVDELSDYKGETAGDGPLPGRSAKHVAHDLLIGD